MNLKEFMENVEQGELGVDGQAAFLHLAIANEAMKCPDLIGSMSQLDLFERTISGTSADD